jgi:hypothetical protein
MSDLPPATEQSVGKYTVATDSVINLVVVTSPGMLTRQVHLTLNAPQDGTLEECTAKAVKWAEDN